MGEIQILEHIFVLALFGALVFFVLKFFGLPILKHLKKINLKEIIKKKSKEKNATIERPTMVSGESPDKAVTKELNKEIPSSIHFKAKRVASALPSEFRDEKQLQSDFFSDKSEINDIISRGPGGLRAGTKSRLHRERMMRKLLRGSDNKSHWAYNKTENKSNVFLREFKKLSKGMQSIIIGDVLRKKE